MPYYLYLIMKTFSSVTVFALSLQSVYSSTLENRDLATIQGVLTSISNQVDQVDNAVKAFNGDSGPLTDANNKLVDTIKSGTSTAQSQPEMSQSDAVQVASYVQTLNSSVATVVDDIISKKSSLCGAGQGNTVLTSLQDQKTASGELADTLTSKTPAALQTIAKQLSSGIASSLQRAVDAFSSNCSGGSATSSGYNSTTTVISTSTSETATITSSGTSSSTSGTVTESTGAASEKKVGGSVVLLAALGFLL